MKVNTRVIYFGMALLLSMLLGACGSSSADGPDGAAAAGMVTKLDDVMKAVIQIEAQGTFVDPEFGVQENAAGTGSGFIIDPSGLAVTNNHVVTGAALLKVRLAGEDELRNARIVAVSECSDLAVIDIDGEGYSYLDWFDAPINVGLDIYVAGFPLGDPEFTLTKGIVSKAKADGESPWSSVDSVVEYDAVTNPGNSGGPVVTEDSKVVAVHYMGNSQTRQAFGISRDLARGVIQQLSGGTDLDSIGVNGEAVSATDGSLTGIWVASVKSGSPADGAGLKPGDIILKMEGLDLATDGTMEDYCDILRTKGVDETLAMEVLRYSTGEVLEGQFNGRSLTVTGSQGPGGAPSGGATGASGYTYVTDDQFILEVEIPSSWVDVDGSEWTWNSQSMGPSIWAAPDLSGFVDTWDVPGMRYNLTTNVNALGGLSGYLDSSWEGFSSACDYLGRESYDDGAFIGQYDTYENCGGTGTSYVILAAAPSVPADFMVIVEVQMVSMSDEEAAGHIFDTFNVIGLASGSGTGGDDPYSSAGSSGSYGEYTQVTDDYNSIVVEVPTAWNQVDGRAWSLNDEIVGAWITASSDLGGFESSWSVPGMNFKVSDDLTNQVGYIELLNTYSAGYRDQCEYDGRYEYDDGYYRGKYDYFVKCGGAGGPGLWLLSAVSKTDQFAYLIVVDVVIASDADWEAVDQIIASFDVVGQLP